MENLINRDDSEVIEKQGENWWIRIRLRHISNSLTEQLEKSEE